MEVKERGSPIRSLAFRSSTHGSTISPPAQSSRPGWSPPSADPGEGADWESAHPLDVGRNGGEAKAAVRELPETRKMLADRDVGTQKDSVNRPGAHPRVVDIMTVDPDKGGPTRYQGLRCSFGQVRVVAEIGFGAPMPVPAGCDEHRLPSQIEPGERIRIDGQPILERPPNQDTLEIRDRFQRKVRQVLAVGVTVERTIHIGAG